MGYHNYKKKLSPMEEKFGIGMAVKYGKKYFIVW